MEVSLEVVAAPMWVSPTQRVMLVDGEIWGREVKGSMWLTCRQVGERSERSDECDWEAGRKESEKVIEWQGEESKWLTGEQEWEGEWVTGEQREGSEWETGEQEEESNWVTGEQRERSEWMTEEQGKGVGK